MGLHSHRSMFGFLHFMKVDVSVSFLLTHAVEMKASCRGYADNLKKVDFVENNQFTCMKSFTYQSGNNHF